MKMTAINWLIEKSKITEFPAEEFDGQTVETTSYYFKGAVPSRMKAEIIKTSTRKTKEGYVGKTEEGIEWAATFGKYISKQNCLVFSANKYEIS
jgi:hypothetical protein